MEYSYPGVYIEEISSGAHPIPGVSHSVPIKRLLAPQDSSVLQALAARVTKGCPGTRLLLTGPNKKRRVSAARALAGRLQLNLYRVDLASVVSKYIGETEKNLGRVFDAARDTGSILFFDEADALFGKRVAVKDSHDRYANVETAFLMQCLEDFHGLVVLATNRRGNIDRAFLRRWRKPCGGEESRTARNANLR